MFDRIDKGMYWDRGATLIGGCTHVSPGCRNCWSEAMAERFGNQPWPFNGNIITHLERIKQFNAKKPQAWSIWNDIFHEDVPFDFIDQVWDVMWANPQHIFMVLTKRPERMLEYIRERAYRREFGWTERSSHFIKLGGYRHYDDILMRDECGYVDADYEAHPDVEIVCQITGEECDYRECPVASQADTREDLEAIGVADEYKYDDEGFAEDCQWMKYYSRPARAGAGNVWLGCTMENQDTYEERVRYMRTIRNFIGPHAILYASIEPILSPIAFRTKYWPENTGEPNWSPLNTKSYRDGSGELDVPVLNWIIVGQETGCSRPRPAKTGWFHEIIKDCQTAGVPVFVKKAPAGVPIIRELPI